MDSYQFILYSNASSFVLSSNEYPAFTPGNYWVYVDPIDSSEDVPFQLDLTLTTPPSHSNALISPILIQNGVPIPLNLSSGSSSFFGLGNLELGACDDILIDYSIQSGGNATIYVSQFAYPDHTSSHWIFSLASSPLSFSQLRIDHTDIDVESLDTFYLTVECETSLCSGVSLILNISKTLGNNTFTGDNFFFSHSDTVDADGINWYEICIPSANFSVNVTEITHGLNQSDANAGADIMISKVKYLDNQFTRYTFSSVPLANLWANWYYNNAPYPNCRDSYFLNSDTPFFRVGTFYIAVYSFCLPSCDYCLTDFSYTIEISPSNDLEQCLSTPVTPSSTTGFYHSSTTSFAFITGGDVSDANMNKININNLIILIIGLHVILLVG